MPLNSDHSHDEHHEAQMKLPWYAIGQLAADEKARVAAHIDGCAACRADLAFEAWLEREIRSLPIDVDQGWRGLAARLQARPARRAQPPTPVGVRWALAAQITLVVMLGAAAGVQLVQRPAYHALAARPAVGGDILLMVRPQTSEAELRRVVQRVDARLVDGPTPTGAYVLRAPKAAQAVTQLRKEPAVVMAEAMSLEQR